LLFGLFGCSETILASTTFAGTMRKPNKSFGKGSVIMAEVLGKRLKVEFRRILTLKRRSWLGSMPSG
jgi:hypothetical protein